MNVLKEDTIALETEEYGVQFRRDDRHVRAHQPEQHLAWVVERWLTRCLLREFRAGGVAYSLPNIRVERDPVYRETVITGYMVYASPFPGHEGEVHVMKVAQIK